MDNFPEKMDLPATVLPDKQIGESWSGIIIDAFTEIDLKTSLLIIGVLASLFWNWRNYSISKGNQKFSEKSAKKDILITRVIAKIDTPLLGLEEMKEKFNSMTIPDLEVDARKIEIDGLNKETILILDRLETALSNADDSEFTNSRDWVKILSPRLDIYHDKMNLLFDEPDDENIVSIKIPQICSVLVDIDKAIKRKIDDSIQDFLKI